MEPEKQPVSDEELACEAQAGSLFDFEELVHRYEGRIFRFVANSIHNQADAQEVTQETFVTAYLKLRQFDAKRSFATWLFTIARRKCIDRHRATRLAFEERMAEPADAKDPSVLLIQREAEDELWQLARRTLPELQCQALWLKYAEEMSVEQIARVLRRTQVHVKVLLFRARTRLARELETQAARETPGGRSYTNSQFPRTLEKPGIRVTRPSKLDEVCKGC